VVFGQLKLTVSALSPTIAVYHPEQWVLGEKRVNAEASNIDFSAWGKLPSWRYVKQLARESSKQQGYSGLVNQ